MDRRGDLKLVYASEKLEVQCTNAKAAKKLFHGDQQLTVSLLSRIILQPLDNDENSYIPCNIDEIAGKVKILEISEVSKHYE